jgi:hypothetical protein
MLPRVRVRAWRIRKMTAADWVDATVELAERAHWAGPDCTPASPMPYLEHAGFGPRLRLPLCNVNFGQYVFDFSCVVFGQFDSQPII